jgi:hypothetical protein
MDRPNEARPGYGSTKRILLVLPQGSTVFHCRMISREARRAGPLLWHGGSSCWMQTHGLGAPFTCSLVVLPLGLLASKQTSCSLSICFPHFASSICISGIACFLSRILYTILSHIKIRVGTKSERERGGITLHRTA